MSVYICPTWAQFPGDTILGCGARIETEPDKEGLVDCPECGIWFKSEQGLAIKSGLATTNENEQ